MHGFKVFNAEADVVVAEMILIGIPDDLHSFPWDHEIDSRPVEVKSRPIGTSEFSSLDKFGPEDFNKKFLHKIQIATEHMKVVKMVRHLISPSF
jgi:hypothetical protein